MDTIQIIVILVAIVIVMGVTIRDGYKLRKFKRKVDAAWDKEMFE